MHKTTIKQCEAEIYEAFSTKWWDPNGPLKALLPMNSVRVPFITEIFEGKIGKQLRVLDIGCGGGILSEGLAQGLLNAGHSSSNVEIIGLDPVKGVITTAKDHLPKELQGIVTYVEATVEEYAKLNDNHAKFDIIVISEVLDHVQNPEILMEQAISLLADGGSIVVTCPAKTALAWIAAVLFGEYILRLVPVGTHHYSNFVALETTKDMMEKNGCRVTKEVGALLNPLTGSWFTSQWLKSFMYMVAAQKEE